MLVLVLLLFVVVVVVVLVVAVMKFFCCCFFVDMAVVVVDGGGGDRGALRVPDQNVPTFTSYPLFSNTVDAQQYEPPIIRPLHISN